MDPVILLFNPARRLVYVHRRRLQNALDRPGFPLRESQVQSQDKLQQGGLGNNRSHHGRYLLLDPVQGNHLADNQMNGERLEPVAILQSPRHILRKTPLDHGLAIGALLDFCINMLDCLLENDIDLRPPLMRATRDFVQRNATDIAGLNPGYGDRFLDPRIAELTGNFPAFAFFNVMGRCRFIFIRLRRRQTPLKR